MQNFSFCSIFTRWGSDAATGWTEKMKEQWKTSNNDDREREREWAGTHRVDPSVFHLPAALWLEQSWRAEVRKWLQTESVQRLLGSQSRHVFLLFIILCIRFDQRSEFVYEGGHECAGYQRVCAAWWHMTRSCGRACARLQMQTAQTAAPPASHHTAFLPRRRTDDAQRSNGQQVIWAGRAHMRTNSL